LFSTRNPYGRRSGGGGKERDRRLIRRGLELKREKKADYQERGLERERTPISRAAWTAKEGSGKLGKNEGGRSGARKEIASKESHRPR